MLDGQTCDTLGVGRTRAPAPPLEDQVPKAPFPEWGGDADHVVTTHEVPFSAPVRRLLDALAAYQVTRPGFGERVGRMGTLH